MEVKRLGIFKTIISYMVNYQLFKCAFLIYWFK